MAAGGGGDEPQRGAGAAAAGEQRQQEAPAQGDRRDNSQEAPPAAEVPRPGVGPGEEVVSLREFQSDVLRVLDVPCRVTAFEVEGNTRTPASTIESAFEGAEEARTFEEVSRALDACVGALESQRVMRSVDVTAVPHPYNDGEATVRIAVEERRPLTYDVGVYTNARTSQLTFEARAGLANALGRFEHIQGACEIASDQTWTYAAGARVPRKLPAFLAAAAVATGRSGGADAFVPHRGEAFAEVRRVSRRWEKYSSINEVSQGVEFGFDSGVPTLGRASYELTWRELGQASLRTSSAVRRQAGHAIKSAVSWGASLGSVDSESCPRSGQQVKWNATLCGVGPDARMLRFARLEAHALGAWPLLRARGGEGLDVTLVCGARAGVIAPWGARLSKPATVVDKFFLGGAGDLRGFMTKGAGPTARRRRPGSATAVAAATAAPAAGVEEDVDINDAAADAAGRDVLGGDLLAFGSVAVQVDPPASSWTERLRSMGVYAQAFADVGALTTLGKGVGALRDNLRASWGVGVAVPITNNAALEINYCVVAQAKAHDRVREGFQVNLRAHGL
eukprot:PRCOL_00004745-RA